MNWECIIKKSFHCGVFVDSESLYLFLDNKIPKEDVKKYRSILKLEPNDKLCISALETEWLKHPISKEWMAFRFCKLDIYENGKKLVQEITGYITDAQLNLKYGDPEFFDVSRVKTIF